MDRELAQALEVIDGGLDALAATGVEPAGAGDAVVVLRELETLSRRLDAAKLAAMDAIDRRGLIGPTVTGR